LVVGVVVSAAIQAIALSMVVVEQVAEDLMVAMLFIPDL
jgi:hypothetical protein